MLLNWLQTLISVISYLWPFKEVPQWDRGIYYVWGRHWKHWPARIDDHTIGPGLWPLIPFFMNVRSGTAAWGVAGTPLQEITTRDGRPLTYSAAMTWRIVDMTAAFHNVDRVLETGQEILANVTAEKLAEVDSSRLSPEKRKRLISDMLRWTNIELAEFGCEASRIRFTNFAVGKTAIRTLRLLMDPALLTDFSK